MTNDIKLILETLRKNKGVPFKLQKVTDTSYETATSNGENTYYYLSIETDLDETDLDISGINENCSSVEEMNKLAEEIASQFDNVTVSELSW